jgi:hypothetical protein
MAKSKQKIRVYVSKVETSTQEMLVINSNFSQNDDLHIVNNGGIPIYPNMKERDIIEHIKHYMISVFNTIMHHLEDSSVKFDIQYLFNKEYSAEGQLLYYNGNNGHDKSTRHFHSVYWVDLKKPLTDKEIELFIKALRQIPEFDK